MKGKNPPGHFLRRLAAGRRFLAAGILAVLPMGAPLEAAWETLEGCRLVKSAGNDGDSFKVRHGGREFVVRLFYVDAPETQADFPDRVRAQARHFGITREKALELGREAGAFTTDFLDGTFTVVTDWSDGWGEATRYRALVRKDGKDLGEQLVREGLARVYGFIPDSAWPGGPSSPRAHRETLRETETRARMAGRGGWQASLNRAPAPEASPGPTTPVDLNTATREELMTLPGVGPTLAARIMEDRPFREVAHLVSVRGIGPVTVGNILPYAIVTLPPVQPYTADYYAENLFLHLDQPVRVSIQALEPLDEEAPEGYAVALAHTAAGPADGGTMRLYAPADAMARAIPVFAAGAEPIDIRAWLRLYRETPVLVLYGPTANPAPEAPAADSMPR